MNRGRLAAMLCSQLIINCQVGDALGEVHFTPGHRGSTWGALLGTITETDAMEFERRPTIDFVVLNSTGGSVAAAMRIGRVLRKASSLALVNEDAQCMSACVLVLAGATSRFLGGRIGIHRPYDPDDQASTSEAQKRKYATLGQQVTAYLGEMNISRKLWDDMLYIAPQHVRVLKPDELTSYGLVAFDPYYEEASDVRQAKRYGVTRLEYAKRRAIANGECPQPPELEVADHKGDMAQVKRLLESWSACKESIMRGKQ